MKYVFCFFVGLTASALTAQSFSAETILNKSITYHDPNGNWDSFRGELLITMQTHNRPKRQTHLQWDFPREYFKSTVTQGGVTTQSLWQKGRCTHWYENSTSFSDAIAQKHRLNCATTTKMRNYYTYLYGLPMKLKDPGAQLDPKVLRRTLNGEPFLCLRVTYTEEVGKDTWYFYLDPESYQLRHYQFYHNESEGDGEYILLSGEEIIQGIKMPKTRAWYTNADDRYLGTDVLNNPAIR